MSVYLIDFSGADMTSLCREAALGPFRTIEFTDIEDISADQVLFSCFFILYSLIFLIETVSSDIIKIISVAD